MSDLDITPVPLLSKQLDGKLIKTFMHLLEGICELTFRASFLHNSAHDVQEVRQLNVSGYMWINLYGEIL